MYRNHLAAGLVPYPLGRLQRSRDPLARFRGQQTPGEGVRMEEKWREGREGERKGWNKGRRGEIREKRGRFHSGTPFFPISRPVSC